MHEQAKQFRQLAGAAIAELQAIVEREAQWHAAEARAGDPPATQPLSVELDRPLTMLVEWAKHHAP